MKTTQAQRKRLAEAFQKRSHNKKLPETERMAARAQAGRWRALIKMGAKRLAKESAAQSSQKLQQDNNP